MSKAETYANMLGVSMMTVHRYANEAGSWELAAIKRVAARRKKYRIGDVKRRAKAARLRERGFTWGEIGEKLGGVTASCAFRLASRHKA